MQPQALSDVSPDDMHAQPMTADGRTRPAQLEDDPVVRVLIVDDNAAIHADFDKILQQMDNDKELAALEAELFGDASPRRDTLRFGLDHAHQGHEGVDKLRLARQQDMPYAIAFVDIRMPPGIDGVETTKRMLRDDPDVIVVICSAYSDHSWEEFSAAFGQTDRVLILKKPFDAVEVRQLGHALHKRWQLARAAAVRVDQLATAVFERTRELEAANAKLVQEAEARERMEVELRLAQKLEAVGQLAAGIAHEINTPMQFIGDNVHFLQTAFDDLQPLIAQYQKLRDAVALAGSHANDVAEIAEAEEEADLEYLAENVPQALERTREGIERVSNIVMAMKEFSHPDQREQRPLDINRALASTLTVAANEYKYVANIETRFGELPTVTCHTGDMNQVFLNLIVNASHAIGSVQRDGKGTIVIETRVLDEGKTAEIAISDDGCGIDRAITDKVFDPFFTTKEVGKGTGQGLAIARSVVVDKHEGELRFDSEPGQGTSFYIRLPVEGCTAGRTK